MTACVKDQAHRDSAASVTEIQAALKNDACMINLMPRRQVEFQRPLTNRDLQIGKSDCDTAVIAWKQLADQKAVMAAMAK